MRHLRIGVLLLAMATVCDADVPGRLTWATRHAHGLERLARKPDRGWFSALGIPVGDYRRKADGIRDVLLEIERADGLTSQQRRSIADIRETLRSGCAGSTGILLSLSSDGAHEEPVLCVPERNGKGK